MYFKCLCPHRYFCFTPIDDNCAYDWVACVEILESFINNFQVCNVLLKTLKSKMFQIHYRFLYLFLI